MADELPGILPPIETPPRAAGHGFSDAAVHASVAYATGHARKRRVFTVAERTVDVSWRLSAADAALLDAWFEDVLGAGVEAFSIQLQAQGADGLQWWKARWLAPPSFAPQEGAASWLVSGRLQVYGAGSDTAPPATPLGMEAALALLGSAALIVSQDLGLELLLPLTQAETLGQVVFGMALMQPALGGSLLSRAWMFPGDLPSAADGGAAALALSVME